MHVYGPIPTVRNTLDIHQGTNNFAITLCFPVILGVCSKQQDVCFLGGFCLFFFIHTHSSVNTWCVFFFFCLLFHDACQLWPICSVNGSNFQLCRGLIPVLWGICGYRNIEQPRENA